MGSKLDKIQAQNAGLSSQLSKDMTQLMSVIQNSNNSYQGNGALLQAMQKWFAAQDEVNALRDGFQVLYFPQIMRREDEVKKAHKETFAWIFEEEDDKIQTLAQDCSQPEDEPEVTPKDRAFLRWLKTTRDDENVFAVFWKPGAGKSTLMKFIAHHPALRSSLNHWSGSRTLIIVQHFFWNHGSIEQRSLTGLLRSLLYQILKQQRQLFAVAFPVSEQEWVLGGESFSFSKSSLTQALERILNAVDDHNMSLFVLIDGLDEFTEQDKHENSTTEESKLVEFLRLFQARAAVKLCVASRPYVTFEKEFGRHRDRSIAIHDLTSEDIKKYIRVTMSRNEMFISLAADDESYHMLVADIIEAAEGVFLWVSLVCQSLLEGISHDDRIQDLRDRLRLLPRELKDLYGHILATIPLQYRQSSARSLFFASNIENRFLSISAHHYLDGAECARLESMRSLSVSRMRVDLNKTMSRHVAQCRGLLESRVDDLSAGAAPLFGLFGEPELHFSHRSIGDFLKMDAIQSDLLRKADFRQPPFLRIMKAHTSALKAYILIDNSTESNKTLHEPCGSTQRGAESLHMRCVLTFDTAMERFSQGQEQVSPRPLEKSVMTVWEDFLHASDLPRQYGIESVWEYTERSIKSGWCQHYNTEKDWPFKYRGLQVAVAFCWPAICQYELGKLRMPIDSFYEEDPCLNFALCEQKFGAITVFVELGLDLTRKLKVVNKTLWEAVLQTSLRVTCNAFGQHEANMLRRLLLSMLRHGAWTDLQVHFAYIDRHHYKNNCYCAIYAAIKQEHKDHAALSNDTANKHNPTNLESKTLGKEVFSYNGDITGLELDWRTHKDAYEVDVLQLFSFSAAELVRHIFTIGFGPEDEPQDLEGLVPLPTDVALLLPPAKIDTETPGQVLTRIHMSTVHSALYDHIHHE
jgi:hypothetical protein